MLITIIVYSVLAIFLLIAVLAAMHYMSISNRYKHRYRDFEVQNSRHIRTRGSVRQAMGRVKTKQAYYTMEDDIHFPDL